MGAPATRTDGLDGDFVRATLDRYERALIDYTRRITGDLHSARDVVQDAFVRLWSQDDAVVARIPEWLFTVCRRLALDRRRKETAMRQREQVVATAPESAPPDPLRELDRQDQADRVDQIIERLPDKQREALRLRFHGGLSYREIGHAMEETEGTVGWLLHQALKTLRERMAATEVRS